MKPTTPQQLLVTGVAALVARVFLSTSGIGLHRRHATARGVYLSSYSVLLAINPPSGLVLVIPSATRPQSKLGVAPLLAGDDSE